MATQADIEALTVIAQAEMQEYVLAAQRFDVLQGTREFTTSTAQGAELVNFSEELYARWRDMMAAEESVSRSQALRYGVIADMIIEARKQHALTQQAQPQAFATPVVN